MTFQRCEVALTGEPARCRHCSNEQLAKRVAEHDDSAFDCLYRRFEGQIGSFIRKQIRDQTHVEDILQEVFMRVYKSASGFDASRKFSSWLYKIALNEVKRYWERSSKLPAYSLNTPIGSADSNLEAEDFLEDPRTAPEDLAAEDLFSRDLKNLIDRLPPKQKTVVLLRVDHELTFEEISEICECPLSTVLSRMRYAIQKLRQWMGIEDQQPTPHKQP